jgi:hypothetical protein
MKLSLLAILGISLAASQLAAQQNDTTYLTCSSLEFSASLQNQKVDTITCVTDPNWVTLKMFDHLANKVQFPKISIPIVKAGHDVLYAGITNAQISAVRITQNSGATVEEISFQFGKATLAAPERPTDVVTLTGTRP